MNSTQVRHACPYCSKDYAGANGLKQHIDKKHWEELGLQPKFVCKFCARPHECTSNLKRHLLSCKRNPDRITTEEGAFECGECSKRFKTKGNLRQHMDKNHPDVPQPPPDNRWRTAMPVEERKKLDRERSRKYRELEKKIEEILKAKWNALEPWERDEWDAKALAMSE
jgi:uncharacterized Zn-finger protein